MEVEGSEKNEGTRRGCKYEERDRRIEEKGGGEGG